jgi:hypothetical protein
MLHMRTIQKVSDEIMRWQKGLYRETTKRDDLERLYEGRDEGLRRVTRGYGERGTV